MRNKSTRARSLRLAALAGALFAFALSSTARGDTIELEEPGPHQGYYLALGGLGDLVLSTRDGGALGNPAWGGHGDLRLGEAIFDWLDLGIGLGAGRAAEEGYRTVFGHLSLEAQLRPVEPLFVRLGIGMGFADVTRTEKSLDEVVGRFGADFTVAVGYDFFLGKRGRSGGFAVTPVAGFRAGPGDLLGTYAVFVGLEISFWTGLPKDRLALPSDEAYLRD